MPCEFPMALSLPPVHVLAPTTRAMHTRNAVRLQYRSRMSGLGRHAVVPLALVNIGTRWHRVFDRKNQDFGDFVLTRMSNPPGAWRKDEYLRNLVRKAFVPCKDVHELQ